MSSETYLTPEQFADVLNKVRKFYDNPLNPIVPDRYQLVYLSWLEKTEVKKPFINNEITHLVKIVEDDIDMQIWSNKDRLQFQDLREGMEISFDGIQTHVGVEFWHQEYKDQGFYIKPNASRSENFASELSEASALRLYHAVKEKIETVYDRRMVKLEEKFLHNISGNPEEPAALTDIISKTPTVGSYGGKSRAAYTFLQNQSVLSTATAGKFPTFERDITKALRQANLYNRGFKGLGINTWMVSGGWLDRYVDVAKDSSMLRYQAELPGIKAIDLGIPDTALSLHGIPVVYCPIMDMMASLTGDDSWNRRAYGLNNASFQWAFAPGEDKEVSFPLDPFDQRVTYMSIDDRCGMYATNPSANIVHEFSE